MTRAAAAAAAAAAAEGVEGDDSTGTSLKGCRRQEASGAEMTCNGQGSFPASTPTHYEDSATED